jgi:hypothetical protein
MSTNPGQLAAFPSSRVESIRRCAQHVRLWLGATGLAYSGAAREAFVRAHPVLFGRAYEVTLRGYDRWRARRAVADTVDGFVRYIACRHERWISVNRLVDGLGGDDSRRLSAIAEATRLPGSGRYQCLATSIVPT